MSRPPKIAYITPNAPYPFNRGGRIRAYHLWRAMSAYADVTPLIVGDSPSPAHRAMMRLAEGRFYPRRRYRADDLARAAAGGRSEVPGLWEILSEDNLPEAIVAQLPTPDALIRHCLNPARIERIVADLRRIQPDLIYLCDTTMAVLAPHVRVLGVPVVAGPHNFDSALYESMSANAPNERLRRWNALAAKAFEAAERLCAPYVDQIWVCSREDGERFAAAGLAAPENIRFAPNVYDLGEPTPPPKGGRDLVFIGQANYYPNEDAIKRLMTISQSLDGNNVAHRMRIVGRIGDGIRRMAKSYPSVEIVGEVDSVLPYIDSAAIAPIALTLGGGTRLKILEALSRARPVLSTPIGIEGIDAENGVSAVIEPNLDRFPARIAELLDDPERAARIAREGWELARRQYSHEALLGHVGDALRDLGLNRAGPTARSLARNLGARILSETASYHHGSRLLSWQIEVGVAGNHDDLSAEFVVPGEQTPANAFVQVRRRRPGRVQLDATAILPADLAPSDMRVALRAWGAEVFLSPPPSDVISENTGLLTVDGDANDLRVTGWTSDEAALFAPEGAQVESLGRSQATGVSLLGARFAGVGQSIAFASPTGVKQDFKDLPRWLASREATSARLRLLKDRHKGETAWLIGNGPSVRIEDLDRLEGHLTFCFNRFHLAHEKTRLRATYTLTGDKQMIEDFGQSIVDDSGGTVFVAHNSAPDLLGDYIWLRQTAVFPPVFSKNPGCVVSPGGATPFVAMQLAWYMGVRKFNFYGADFSFRFESGRAGGDAFRSARGEGNHFIANYRSGKPWCPPSLRDIGIAFFVARLLTESEGGFIRNVTRGGALEIFERADFDRALEMDLVQNMDRAQKLDQAQGMDLS